LFAALAIVAFTVTGSPAATINVLWYTGGTEVSGPGTYETDIGNLVGQAAAAPGNNTWNLTFWQGGAMPAGTFNVLVAASDLGS
jgi:hypothetical protein